MTDSAKKVYPKSYYCDQCPHAVFLHDATGCGCGCRRVFSAEEVATMNADYDAANRPAPALVPLDVEAVARWLYSDDAVRRVYDPEWEGAPDNIRDAYRADAQRFVATFGVPAPDAEALRLAEWCEHQAARNDEFVDKDDPDDVRVTDSVNEHLRAIAARLRGEKGVR